MLNIVNRLTQMKRMLGIAYDTGENMISTRSIKAVECALYVLTCQTRCKIYLTAKCMSSFDRWADEANFSTGRNLSC